MEVGQTYKVSIIDEDNIGNGIAKINDFVVFVKNGLKDDKLEIEITKVNKRFANAIITKIINPSKNRTFSKCKYYESCGGCAFLHTTYHNERTIKHNYLEKLFETKIEYLPILNEYNYRNKVTLHVKDGKVGFYNENTHDLCEIDSCLLLDNLINEKIKEIKRFDLSKISEIMIRVINNKTMISVKSSEDDINIKNIKCDSLYINDKFIKGEEYLIDEVGEYKFCVYPESFYQVNKDIMIKIYKKAYELIKKSESLLDLYCGIGTIGIWMHDKFDHIKGIEINKSAIDAANINKELNNINNIEFECNDAKNTLAHFDTIIVDPPRSGLSVHVLTHLLYSEAKQIVYISCNPNTLKRDLLFLSKYEPKYFGCADMFPRTKHIEMICLLELKG